MSAQLQHDPDDLKRAFRQGGHGRDMDARLDAVAEVGAKVGFEDAKEQIIEKLDDLIWRRKIQDKPSGTLEEIKGLVEDL